MDDLDFLPPIQEPKNEEKQRRLEKNEFIITKATNGMGKIRIELSKLDGGIEGGKIKLACIIPISEGEEEKIRKLIGFIIPLTMEGNLQKNAVEEINKLLRNNKG